VNPTFLSLGEVLEIHRDQINRYGGDPGIRDLGLLQSALAMPAAGCGGRFVHGDLYEMAAAYLFHIIQHHPFVDGNKRTGVVAALVFLALNDVVIDVEEDVFENVVWAVAEGQAAKSTVSEFFRKHAQEGEGP
jgi:death-on-curing protein